MADKWQVPHEEARRRLSGQFAVQLMADHLAETMPNLFSGAWFDDRGVATYAFTISNPALNATVRAALPNPDLVDFVVGQRSRRSIDAAGDELRATLLREKIHSDERPVYVTTDEKLGVLDIEYGGRPDQSLENTVSRKSKGAPTRFRHGALKSQDISCTSARNCPDIPGRGGISITIPGSATPSCTAGFVMWSTQRMKRELLTAGHCSKSAEDPFGTCLPNEVFHPYSTGTVKLGRAITCADHGPYDATVIDYVAHYENNSKNGIYRYPASPNYPIKSYYKYDRAMIGMEMCSSGKNTPTQYTSKCGTVDFRTLEVTPGKRPVTE